MVCNDRWGGGCGGNTKAASVPPCPLAGCSGGGGGVALNTLVEGCGCGANSNSGAGVGAPGKVKPLSDASRARHTHTQVVSWSVGTKSMRTCAIPEHIAHNPDSPFGCALGGTSGLSSPAKLVVPDRFCADPSVCMCSPGFGVLLLLVCDLFFCALWRPRRFMRSPFEFATFFCGDPSPTVNMVALSLVEGAVVPLVAYMS